MTKQLSKVEAFHKWHVAGKPLVLFNVWDAGSAKAVTQGGVKAVATSSWAVADAHGFPDGEQIPRDLAMANLRRIVGVTELPVTVDIESGYGDDPETVGETIRLAIEAGSVGCNLEDSFPADGKMRKTADQAARIRRGREIADASKLRFFINARTDVFFQAAAKEHNEAMVAETLERAKAYADAGADGLFAPGLANMKLIARLAKASPLPLNIMVGMNPALPELAESGVARVSYGGNSYGNAMKILEEAARAASK